MRKLDVNLKNKNYSILIQNGIIKDIVKYINNVTKGNKLVIITDTNVEKLYLNRILMYLNNSIYDIKIIVIKSGEKYKSMQTLNDIYDKLCDFSINRDDMIIAFGGGVVGDIAGFVASTYLRGISYIQIPTTLLSQVDSSVGGKVAVNLSKGKNLVGNFYQPKLVLIDTNFLNTLSEKHIKDGMCEIIKYACLEDKDLYNVLLNYNLNNLFKDEKILENIIYMCCSIKKKYVEEDEFDKGRRILLNFGHTIAHVIENYYNYKHYTHGEAVAIGMRYVIVWGQKNNLTKVSTVEDIEKLLDRYYIKYQLPKMDKNNIVDIIKLDKKVEKNIIKLVVLKTIGEPYIYRLNLNEIYKFL